LRHSDFYQNSTNVPRSENRQPYRSQSPPLRTTRSYRSRTPVMRNRTPPRYTKSRSTSRSRRSRSRSRSRYFVFLFTFEVVFLSKQVLTSLNILFCQDISLLLNSTIYLSTFRKNFILLEMKKLLFGFCSN